MMKCATNPSENAMTPIVALNVAAIANSANPNSHTKLSPAKACPHFGAMLPDGTRGRTDGQNRGTAFK